MNQEDLSKNIQIHSTQEIPETIRSFRILLAEDDLEMRKLLAWSLVRQGYEVVECQDGYGLMKKLGLLDSSEDQQMFDLIISDIRMPGVTGLQVLESAKEFDAFPNMILIAAFPDKETLNQAQRLGAAAIFNKPFDIDDLLAKVAELALLPLISGNKLQIPAQVERVTLPFPLKIVFRHDPKLDSIIDIVHSVATKLNSFSDQIINCRVVIEESNHHNYRNHICRVSINLAIPGKTIVVKQNSEKGPGYENLYRAIQIAFSKVCHQMKDYQRKHDRKKGHERAREREETGRRDNPWRKMEL